MKRFPVLVAIVAVVGGASSGNSFAGNGEVHRAQRPIPGQYIVLLSDDIADVSAVADQVARRYAGVLERVFTSAVKGFSVRTTEGMARVLSLDPQVVLVEEDGEISIDATQTDATWGIDRIDQLALPLSTTFTYKNTGAGVNAYIIDTGIRTAHTDFGRRALIGTDTVGDGQNGIDCHGHGTHVAATTGGSTWGVAKGVKLFAVRVLNCKGSGTTSGVIAGVDWVKANHVKPAVANMSLGGGASTALDTAVKNSIAAGVGYAIAAGNGNIVGIAQDACKTSPARVPEAMTISATDKTDKKASFANFGNCVDWFAPGVGITSAWIDNNTATKTISGTSMATPHTTGVAALFLQSNPAATPQQVRDALFAKTTRSIVTSSKTTNNHLLFTDF